jgi:HK97 family phage portal protein
MVGLIETVRGWFARVFRPTRGLLSTGGGGGGQFGSSEMAVEMGLQSAALWACLRLISQSISVLPGHVFEETPTGKTKAINHPLYRALSRQPNAVMTFCQWTQTTVLHLLCYGNAFTLPLVVDGEVVGLWPLDPARVRIIWRTDGTFHYRLYSSAGVPEDYQPLDILHFRIFSLDGIVGLSPLDYHRLTLEGEAAAHLYATTIFKNGGRPSGVLEYPGTLKKEQIDGIRTSWADIHNGPEGAGRVAVLENGTKYTPISVPLQQLEYISQQKYSAEKIARIFGVPPHLIGAMDQTPYASVEQQSLEFSQYTQQPIITSIEQTIETVLLTPPFIFRFNMNAFQRADISSRYRAYATGRQWGWLSVNTILELEEMNQIGPDGDIYLQPLNMVPASAANADPPQPLGFAPQGAQQKVPQ